MNLIISGLILVTGLQAFAARTLVEYGQLAREKTEQIQELQIRRVNSISAINAGANTYMPWVYMQEARRNTFMGAMGLSSPSREEQQLRAGAHRSGYTGEDTDKLSWAINENIELRSRIFSEALEQYPEHALDILESIRTVLVAEKQMFLQEKAVTALAFKVPYPNARSNWSAERDRLWKNHTQIALYEGQMRVNSGTYYEQSKTEKQTSERIKAIEAGIADMDRRIAEVRGGGNSCGLKLGGK